MMACKKDKPTVLKFQTEDDVAIALAKKIAHLSLKFIKQKGCFTIVLSGGTLIDTLRKLVEPPYIDSIDWSKWLVFFLDERVVPLNHPDSNYKLAYDGFLCKVGIPEANVYPINDKLSAEAAADEYEARIEKVVESKKLGISKTSGFPKFDLMLLGMGPEGHVASLFCWHFQRYENKRWVTFIKDSPKLPSERITLTFPVINASSHIALVVTGKEVADAVKVALCCVQAQIPLPVQMVSPYNYDEDGGELTWFLDKEAVSKCRDPHSTCLIVGCSLLACSLAILALQLFS